MSARAWIPIDDEEEDDELAIRRLTPWIPGGLALAGVPWVLSHLGWIPENCSLPVLTVVGLAISWHCFQRVRLRRRRVLERRLGFELSLDREAYSPGDTVVLTFCARPQERLLIEGLRGRLRLRRGEQRRERRRRKRYWWKTLYESPPRLRPGVAIAAGETHTAFFELSLPSREEIREASVPSDWTQEGFESVDPGHFWRFEWLAEVEVEITGLDPERPSVELKLLKTPPPQASEPPAGE